MELREFCELMDEFVFQIDDDVLREELKGALMRLLNHRSSYPPVCALLDDTREPRS